MRNATSPVGARVRAAQRTNVRIKDKRTGMARPFPLWRLRSGLCCRPSIQYSGVASPQARIVIQHFGRLCGSRERHSNFCTGEALARCDARSFSARATSTAIPRNDTGEMEPEFGKPLKSSKAFDTPPYYAIQIFPLARKNFGGVKTDLKCRVLDKHFDPIAGLYAAGEVAGMAGGHINGRAGLEGTMLGPAIFSGRVAGGWAAQAAGHGCGFVGRPNRS